jgi:hypothetical protein
LRFTRRSITLTVFYMLRRFTGIGLRGLATVALALFATCVFAPSRAEASCGDYVKVNGHNSTMDHETANSSQNGAPTHDPAAPRCHGPHCSNGSFPPAAPAPKLEVRVEDWALPGGFEVSLSPESGSLLAEQREIPCAGYGLSILRPPR